MSYPASRRSVAISTYCELAVARGEKRMRLPHFFQVKRGFFLIAHIDRVIKILYPLTWEQRLSGRQNKKQYQFSKDQELALLIKMNKGKGPKKLAAGFSLIESLISLTLFLIILLYSLEFFASSRSHFLKLKDEQETNEAAYSALDKMRKDIAQAGSGLIAPVRLGILDCISENNGVFIIYTKEKDLSLLTDLVPGQTRIQVRSTKKIKKGRELCIFDSVKGEFKAISSVYKGSLVLSSPLNSPYLKEKASLVLMKKISFFLDEGKHILRRKVNASPAQPLLEEVTYFDFDHEKSSNLVKLRLELKINKHKEREYEISVFPKNLALSWTR